LCCAAATCHNWFEAGGVVLQLAAAAVLMLVGVRSEAAAPFLSQSLPAAYRRAPPTTVILFIVHIPLAPTSAYMDTIPVFAPALLALKVHIRQHGGMSEL
jgi:hypothetical protein